MLYRGANVRLLKHPTSADVRALLSTMKAHGANAVSFNTIHKVFLDGAYVTYPPSTWTPGWLIFPDITQDPNHPFGDTVDIDRLHAACLEARKQGYERIVLKPMIDSDYGAWRGWIGVSKALRLKFLSDYKNRLLAPLFPILKDPALSPYVDLCFGTEMVQITRDWGAEFWLNIASWLRYKGVKNRLTYAANWGWWNPNGPGEFRQLLPLWLSNYGVYAGIDAYWPMAGKHFSGTITTELLLNGAERNVGWQRVQEDDSGVPFHWSIPIADDIAQFRSELAGRPFTLTETGYPRTDYAAVDPPRDPVGAWSPDYTQARPLVEAARIFWDDKVEGCYWWEAAYGTAGVDGTHNLLGPGNDLGTLAWRA